MTKICTKCGSPFEPIYNEQDCAACIGKEVLKKIRKFGNYKNIRPLISKPCRDCGEIMHNVTIAQLLCDRCRGIKELQRRKSVEQKRKERRAELAEIKQQQKEKALAQSGSESIAAVAAAARAAGMTYGKYVALLHKEGAR